MSDSRPRTPDVPWTLAADLVPGIVAELDDLTTVDEHNTVGQHALELAETYQLHEISSGKAPRTIAASCVYVACLLNDVRTHQDRIADAADCSTVSIRNTYRDIFRAEETDLDQVPTFNGPAPERDREPENKSLSDIAEKYFGGDR